MPLINRALSLTFVILIAKTFPCAAANVELWCGLRALGNGPMLALTGQGNWTIPSEVEYSKNTFVFDHPIAFSRIDLESCQGPFQSGFDVFADFNEEPLSKDGDKKFLSFTPAKGESKLKSLTILHDGQGSTCVSKIKISSGNQSLNIKNVRDADSVLTKEVYPLFDGRPDTTYVFEKPVEIKFPREERIDSVNFWNGDQVSRAAFKESEKVKYLVFEGEKGFQEKIELKNTPQMQHIKLHKVFVGKHLKITALQGFSKKTELAMAEMQFASGDTLWRPATAEYIRADERALKSLFESHGLARILDRSLSTVVDGETWTARFRSDGSFYFRGFSDDLKQARSYTAFGHFNVTKSSEGKIQVLTRGILRFSATGLDSAECGRLAEEGSEKSVVEKSFEEPYRFEKISGQNLIDLRSLRDSKQDNVLKFDLLKLSPFEEID